MKYKLAIRYRKILGLLKQGNKKLDFIIIGGQKCGTTALFEFLESHPQLFGPIKKEVNFFNSLDYKLGIDYYHGFFPKARTHQYLFEASPSYLMDHNSIAAERIYTYYPNIRLIVLLREPVARAFSAFKMYQKKFRANPQWFKIWKDDRFDYIARKKEDYESFNYYIKSELEALDKGKRIEAPVLSPGKYVDGIRTYLKFFDREQIHFIGNTSLKENTHDELNLLLNFIGIEEKYIWNFPDGAMIFSGGYNDEIERKAREQLTDYYKSSNIELFNLIGHSLDW